ncbi:MAG: hypothetical protein IKX88_08505 [Thermoguttaceae bacterium]|nr:hypothetical protein [Thermoguttaceae bacterium]
MAFYARGYDQYLKSTRNGGFELSRKQYYLNACELQGDWSAALGWANRIEAPSAADWTRPRIYYKAGFKRQAFAGYCAALKERFSHGVCSGEEAFRVVNAVTLYGDGTSRERRLSSFWEYSDFLEFMKNEFEFEGTPEEFQRSMSIFRSIRVDRAEWDAALQNRLNTLSSARREKLLLQTQQMRDDYLNRQKTYRNQRIEGELRPQYVSEFEDPVKDSPFKTVLRYGFNGYGVMGEICLILAFVSSFSYAGRTSRRRNLKEFHPFTGILVGIIVALVASCYDATSLADGIVRYDVCFRPIFGAVGGYWGALLHSALARAGLDDAP